jgi:hypothetical protein
MNRSRKKLYILALGAVASVLVAVAAFAYWTGNGSGSGSGAVGTNGAATLTGTVASGVAPGTARAVSFTAANPSSSAIRVTTIHLESVTADGAHAACSTADFSMADVTENHQVPANATVDPMPTNGSLVYADTAVSQDACKGATLTLTLSST